MRQDLLDHLGETADSVGLTWMARADAYSTLLLEPKTGARERIESGAACYDVVVAMLPSRMLLLLAAWLIPTTAAYALILTSDQRGAGMDGTLLILLATLIGGVSLLAAFVTLFGSGFHRSPTRFRSFLMCMAVAASCAGVLPVLYYGRVLYLQDQEEAKRFVEQRIADASVRVAEGQPWPATQEHFIAGQPLPRLLRGKRFYTHEADDHFVIDIPVDFGIAWVYDSRRGTWHYST